MDDNEIELKIKNPIENFKNEKILEKKNSEKLEQIPNNYYSLFHVKPMDIFGTYY